MKLILSLSVERPHRIVTLLWPSGVKQLVVLVARPGSSKRALLASGIDPASGRIVFEARVRPAQLGGFIKAVIEGERPRKPARSPRRDRASGRVASTVVVPNPYPPSTGPSFVQVASAIAAAMTGARRKTPRAR